MSLELQAAWRICKTCCAVCEVRPVHPSTRGGWCRCYKGSMLRRSSCVEEGGNEAGCHCAQPGQQQSLLQRRIGGIRRASVSRGCLQLATQLNSQVVRAHALMAWDRENLNRPGCAWILQFCFVASATCFFSLAIRCSTPSVQFAILS